MEPIDRENRLRLAKLVAKEIVKRDQNRKLNQKQTQTKEEVGMRRFWISEDESKQLDNMTVRALADNPVMRCKNIIFLFFIIPTVSMLLMCNDGNMNDKPRWRAIVAFTDTDSDDVSEDWAWFYSDIQEACKEERIFVIYAGPEDRQVIVGSRGKSLANVNISEYFIRYRKGYLFMESGRETRFQKYDQSDVVLENASEYFGIPLMRTN